MSKRKILALFMGILLMTSLYACTDEKEDDSTTDVTTTVGNATTTEEPSPIDSFVDKMTSEKYSYEMIFTSVENNVTEVISYQFAKDGVISAFSMLDEDNVRTTFLNTAELSYLITEDGTEKTAFIYPAGEDNDISLDLSYLTNFGDSYIFDEKTSNVLVGNINTTCYEYSYYGITYKYYVTQDEMVVKVEFSDDTGMMTTIEIKDFKTTNINTSLFTVPTEEAGYQIFDTSNLY